MTIQHLTNKANTTTLPSKSTPKEASVRTDVQTPKQSKDSVDMSAVAKEITKAFESSNSTPVINEDRVKAVKKALENKTYSINAEEIAKKMIQLERDQYNDSR